MNFEKAKQYFLDGLAQIDIGAFKEAELSLLKSLELIPDRISTLTNLSAIQIKLQKFSEAKTFAEKAIGMDQNNYEAFFNLGVIAVEEKKYSLALEFLDKAISLHPNYYQAWSSKGIALNELKLCDQALVAYDKAIKIKPDYHEAWSNKGMVLNELKRYDEALAVYDKAIDIKPDYHEAWSNKGFVLCDLKRYDEALAAYDKAIEINPNYYDAHFNKALAQLTIGVFHEGWKNYEFRWKHSYAQPLKHQEIPALTNLNNLKGKKILVWSEQGYGDTIQFSRFIEKLSSLGAQVTFEVQEPLKTLIANSLQHMHVIHQGEPFERVDYQIPLVSLPLLFQVNIEHIPNPTSYLKCSEENYEAWKKKLNLSNKKLNIGIACSGNENYRNDKNRPIKLSAFSPLINITNLFLIQKDVRKSDADFLKTHPEIRFLGNAIKSFDDSASIISQMDLIITIDTSLAHLSGALGRPTFLLISWSPDWRWLLDRDTSPWYRSLKIFRQPTIDNWDAVIKNVLDELPLNI